MGDSPLQAGECLMREREREEVMARLHGQVPVALMYTDYWVAMLQ